MITVYNQIPKFLTTEYVILLSGQNHKKKTFYCYSETEKQEAIRALRGKAEITRFKGLGEISPGEFKDFINENMRLEPVVLQQDTSLDDLLSYYMGKNTPQRQEFIIDNLRIELDEVEDDIEIAEAMEKVEVEEGEMADFSY